MSKFKSLAIALLSVLALSACDSDDEENFTNIDSVTIYPQTMCKAPTILVEDSSIQSVIANAVTADSSFKDYLNRVCNQSIPNSIPIPASSISGPDDITINRGNDEVFRAYQEISFFNYPALDSVLYSDLKYVVMDNENNGIVTQSRIVGLYNGYHFDIIFNLKDNWVNGRFFQPKVLLNGGSGLQVSNFSNSVNPNLTFINSLVDNDPGDFTDLVNNYCSAIANSNYVFYHNGDRASLSGSNIVANNVSSIGNLQQEVNSSTYSVENITVTVTPANKVTFNFDVRDNTNALFSGHVLECN